MNNELSDKLREIKKNLNNGGAIGTTTNNSVKNSVRPQNKHLKPFKKGVSGNPGGRTKGKLNYETIREMAIIKLGKKAGKSPSEIEADLVVVAIQQALKGNYRFYKDDLDRTYGQAVSRSEIGGLEGESPIRIELGVQRILDKIYGEKLNEN